MASKHILPRDDMFGRHRALVPNSSLNCLRSSPVPAKQQAWNFKARYCGRQICQMATAHLHFHLWCGCVWLTPGRVPTPNRPTSDTSDRSQRKAEALAKRILCWVRSSCKRKTTHREKQSKQCISLYVGVCCTSRGHAGGRKS